MDSGFKLKQESPKKSANILSKIFFTWMVGLFVKGSRRGLKVIDLFKTLDCDKSDTLGDRLERNWEIEIARTKTKKPSLLRALIKTIFWHYMAYGVLLFVQFLLLRSCQPVVLAKLLKLFAKEKDSVTKDEIYMYSGVLSAMSLFAIFLMHHTNYGMASIGMRVRIAVSSLVYRKLIKLNKVSSGQTAAGQVVNLLSNDVTRFDMVILFLHYLWIMPFEIALVTYFIWQEVGISSLAGVVSMACLTLPVQGYLAKLTSFLRFETAKRTDHRVKLMNEVIQGMQVIKMYAWEKPFEKLIDLARKKEINVITKSSYLRAFYTSSMVYIERLTLFLTCLSYSLLGNPITADKVFSMAQFFNLLQSAMAIFYPNAISLGAEALVAIKRLETFLQLEEKEPFIPLPDKEKEIRLANVNASWTTTETLKNLNVHIPKGNLCAIIGPVGSGKSSILQVLLGELSIQSGTVYMDGDISYSSQESWLFSGTVRSNILFGLPYDHSKYKEVVKVCALEKDFEQFRQGDRTIVGERGVSLSGGQRARINLARAVYREADIYLLDDPLSAVDTHVGKHLFNECIKSYLKTKTRILVTHQLQFLKKADFIIVLDEGEVQAQGTFKELSESDLDFTKLMVAADESNDKKEDEKKEDEKEEETKMFGCSVTYRRLMRANSILSCRSCNSDSVEMENDVVNDNEEEMVDENSAPFKEYYKSSKSVFLIILLFITLVLSQTVCSGADFWVTYWSQEDTLRHSGNKTFESRALDDPIIVLQDQQEISNNTFFYRTFKEIESYYDQMFETVIIDEQPNRMMKNEFIIYIYAILIIGTIFFTLSRSMLFFKIAMRASTNLHHKMFHCLLETPMRFFDINPSGRVLNRFSKDMGAIDEILPRVLLEATQIILVMTGILVNVGISNPYIIIAMVVLGIVFLVLRKWYIATAKDIKLIEGIAKSPMFSHVNASLNGLTTIRASQAERKLIQQFDHHQDVHTSAWSLTITCIVSFGLWLDLVCVIFIACVTFSFAFLYDYSNVNNSLAGLAISQSLILTGMLQYGMRQTAEVVNQLTSVDRVLQYTKLEKEGPFLTENDKLPVIPWPVNGLIEFRNLYLTYVATETPILKDLCVTIQAGEKIGIVGRTGAGKSTIISALFRLAPTEGSIIIDGVDTKNIGLTDLRRNISIIPQEPVLFSATLRNNLDPFHEFADEKLWKALQDVELKESVPSLDFLVSDSGSNFSVGQRQLVCLARAILRNNKILVLDEATANVDPQTDFLIQQTIRSKFKDCTVLTIAHRLNTIMDSDRVLVMDSGTLAEYAHPHILLQNPDSLFTRMVEETGETMTMQLKEIAFVSYSSRM